MSILRYLFISFALSLVSAFLTIQTSSAQPLDLSGEWETSYGAITLAPISDGFEGPYSSDDGKLRLIYSVEGIYEGYWEESSSSVRCNEPGDINGSYYWGRIKGAVPERRESFTLSWSYCDLEDYAYSWNFTPTNPDPAPTAPVASVEGNWRVTWVDSTESPAFVSVYPDYAWDCTAPTDSWCQKRIKGPLVLSAGQPDGTPNARVTQDGTALQLEWTYGHLGHWGGNSTLSIIDEDHLQGEWSNGNGNGAEIWERAKSTVTRVGGVSIIDGQSILNPTLPLGRPATLSTRYKSPNFNFRGNRNRVYLHVYGDNLWGQHEHFLPRESGLEIKERHYLCASGQSIPVLVGNSSCMNEGGVRGISLELIVWPHAQPGMKYLKFNNQTVPFILDVVDFPTPIATEPTFVEVSRIVLLDDQMGARREPGDLAKNYSYPYDRQGNRTAGLNTRFLVVVGKNIDLDGETYFASHDPKIQYERLELPANIQRAVERAAISLSGIDLQRGEQVVPVKAHLQNGAQGGFKSLLVNGRHGAWPLAFKGLGTVKFLRPNSTPTDPEANVFYHGETIRLGVHAADDNYPTDNLKFVIEAVRSSPNGDESARESRRVGPVVLQRSDDAQRGQNFAYSELFLISKMGETPIELEENEKRLELRDGESLIARAETPLSLITMPYTAKAEIIDRPRRANLWEEALNRVSACRGLGGDATDPSFANETSKVYSNWILTEGQTRQITLTKGHHAALILIRDELLPVIHDANESLLPFIADGEQGKTLAQRYWSAAKANPTARANGFWTGRTRTITQSQIIAGRRINREIQFTLAETFDVAALRQKTRMRNRVETQDLINDTVAKNLKLQYDQTKAALLRAERAYDCKVDDLLAIAGRAAPASFETLMPELVVQEGERWRRDINARGAVRAVHTLSQAVRDQRQYAQIDNAYKSLAIAFFASAGSFGGAAMATSSNTYLSGIGTASAWASLGADFFDVAVFGTRGVDDSQQGEMDFLTAMGLAPFINSDLVREAESQRSSELAATIGVLAPILGGAAGTTLLEDIARINRGRALVRERRVLRNLDEQTPAQRTNVAAYFENLNASQSSRFTDLTDAERVDLFNFNALQSTSRTSETVDDNFFDLQIGELGTAPRRSDGASTSTRPSEPSPAGPGGAPRPDRTDIEDAALDGTQIDPNMAREQERARLRRAQAENEARNAEPPVAWNPDLSRNVEEHAPGEISKHLSDRDADKLMRLTRELTPEEQAMRDDMLDQFVNAPESMPPSRREIVAKSLGENRFKRYGTARLSPYDDSADLPPPSNPSVDWSTTPPGSLTKDLSDSEIEDLVREGANLSREEILRKLDLYRSGRVPPGTAIDDDFAAELDRVYEEWYQNKRRGLGPGGTQIMDPPGPAAARVPDDELLDAVGPFRGIYAEESNRGRMSAAQKRMPAGTQQKVASPNKPMVLDPKVSETYIYTVMPNGEVRYFPQKYTAGKDAFGNDIQVDMFKHSMLSEGSVAGQSGELKYVNGRWVMNNNSGRYGLYVDPQTGSSISRSRRSLEAARQIVEKYRVVTPDGAKIELGLQYNRFRVPE